MKKLFFFAAAAMTCMSLMAEVEFKYLPTIGDKNAAGVEFTKSDKVEVLADELLIDGTNFKVYNAYKTTYKAVGMTADSAFESISIGDQVVDLTSYRIQGQDNPTAGGGNPVIDMKVPNAGACFKVDVQQDGYLYVVVKATPNKQQFAFEQVVASASGALSADMIEFFYGMMSVTTTEIGNPQGCLRVQYKGDEGGYLLAPPAMPYTYYTNNAYSTNGAGIMVVKVEKDLSPYIIGTAGSKMMAAGFAFSPEAVDVVAISSKKMPAYQEDVTLYSASGTGIEIKEADCSKEPIFVRVKLPKNESAVAEDSTINVWNQWSTKDQKYNTNITAYVWTDGGNSSFRSMSKSGSYYVLQVDDLTEFNALFLADKVSSFDGVNKNAQTEDVLGITASACYQVGDVDHENKDNKCAIITLDCLTGDPITGIEEVMANEQVNNKVIIDGNLYIINDGVVYNAQGAVVAL